MRAAELAMTTTVLLAVAVLLAYTVTPPVGVNAPACAAMAASALRMGEGAYTIYSPCVVKMQGHRITAEEAGASVTVYSPVSGSGVAGPFVQNFYSQGGSCQASQLPPRRITWTKCPLCPKTEMRPGDYHMSSTNGETCMALIHTGEWVRSVAKIVQTSGLPANLLMTMQCSNCTGDARLGGHRPGESFEASVGEEYELDVRVMGSGDWYAEVNINVIFGNETVKTFKVVLLPP